MKKCSLIVLSISMIFVVSCSDGKEKLFPTVSSDSLNASKTITPPLITSMENYYAKEFYPNSKIKYEGEARNGKKNGYWKYYHENGNLKAQGIFLNDIMVFWWKEYDENGKLICEGQRDGNCKTGYCKNYNQGIIQNEGILECGRRRGSWMEYDSAGKLMRIMEYGGQEKQ